MIFCAFVTLNTFWFYKYLGNMFVCVCICFFKLFAKHNWNYEVKEDEMGRAYSTIGGREDRVYIFGGKPEGKRPLGRLRCRWVDNIKIDLRETGWGGVDWVGLALNRDRWRDVCVIMNLWVP
jgi:hypothetical protein